METIYLCIVIFLLCLAVFDLFVGVSNDAVNFLQSAVGARVASFRTILIIASVGVMLGAVMSSGMMDVARHGIMMPAHYSFHEVMTIMLAVMVTDIIVLDAFNTLGMPTSTTVSLVFELLGGTAMLALLKVMGDPTLEYADLLNSDKALQVIIAIFVSVAISFVIGMIVMWLSRIVFTFHYSKHSRYSIAIFGGIAFTALSYFIFMKGMGKSPYLPENLRDYIEEHTNWLLLCTFLVSTVAMQLLHLLRVNIFKFTVLMGTFGRESAVFRVTGVLSVIGGWFITAGVAFIACALVCLAMWFGGVIVQCGFMALVVFLLYRSNRQYKAKSAKAKQEDDTFRLMMRTRDPELVWEMLRSHVRDTQSTVCKYIMEQYNGIVEAFATQNVRALRQSQKSMRRELDLLKKYRRQEMLGLRRSPMDLAIERNTWFHVGINSDQQYVYTLRRMLAPIKEHVDNNFNPLPKAYETEYEPIRRRVNELMRATYEQISTGQYANYRATLAEADGCKDDLSLVRKEHLNRMQKSHGTKMIQVDLVYLNLLQETQQLLSVMRHQLRAAKKFMEEGQGQLQSLAD